MTSKPKRLEMALKLVTWGVLVAGTVVTARMSGMWRNFEEPQGFVGLLWVSASFLLFGVATALGRRLVTVLLILGAAVFAIYFGLTNYHEAFWGSHRSDINGLVLLFVPVVQGVIGLAALVVALIDWWAYRRGQRSTPVASRS